MKKAAATESVIPLEFDEMLALGEEDFSPLSPEELDSFEELADEGVGRAEKTRDLPQGEEHFEALPAALLSRDFDDESGAVILAEHDLAPVAAAAHLVMAGSGPPEEKFLFDEELIGPRLGFAVDPASGALQLKDEDLARQASLAELAGRQGRGLDPATGALRLEIGDLALSFAKIEELAEKFGANVDPESGALLLQERDLAPRQWLAALAGFYGRGVDDATGALALMESDVAENQSRFALTASSLGYELDETTGAPRLTLGDLAAIEPAREIAATLGYGLDAATGALLLGESDVAQLAAKKPGRFRPPVGQRRQVLSPQEQHEKDQRLRKFCLWSTLIFVPAAGVNLYVKFVRGVLEPAAYEQFAESYGRVAAWLLHKDGSDPHAGIALCTAATLSFIVAGLFVLYLKYMRVLLRPEAYEQALQSQSNAMAWKARVSKTLVRLRYQNSGDPGRGAEFNVRP